MKYEFANVLVADTRLLMNMSEPENYPRVLVLNNQLNETCSRQQQQQHNQRHLNLHPSASAARQSNCSTCCLRIEEPEFKKRAHLDEYDSMTTPTTTTDQQQQQCFGKCVSMQPPSYSSKGKSVKLTSDLIEQTNSQLQ